MNEQQYWQMMLEQGQVSPDQVPTQYRNSQPQPIGSFQQPQQSQFNYGSSASYMQPYQQQNTAQPFNFGSSQDYMGYANNPQQYDMTQIQSGTGGGETGGGVSPQQAQGISSGIQAVASGAVDVIDTIGGIKKGILKAAPSILNGLIDERHNERVRAPQMAYNQDRYGSQFNNIFEDGGSVSRAKSILNGGGDLTKREKNFYNFISATDNVAVAEKPRMPDAPYLPQYQDYNTGKPWGGGDTSQYNQGFQQGIYQQPQVGPALTPELLDGYEEGRVMRQAIKPEYQPRFSTDTQEMNRLIQSGSPSIKQWGGSVGDEVELTQEEIDQLTKLGYQFG